MRRLPVPPIHAGAPHVGRGPVPRRRCSQPAADAHLPGGAEACRWHCRLMPSFTMVPGGGAQGQWRLPARKPDATAASWKAARRQQWRGLSQGDLRSKVHKAGPATGRPPDGRNGGACRREVCAAKLTRLAHPRRQDKRNPEGHNSVMRSVTSSECPIRRADTMGMRSIPGEE